MTLAESTSTKPKDQLFQFAGFDTGDYPGDQVMTAWAGGKSPYSFICYYLDAPCHTRHGYPNPWSGHRQFLDQLGWGFIITYFGRQASGCGADELTLSQGSADGADAVAKTRAEGFPPGAIIFLDVEAIQTFPALKAYLDYFEGWLAAVIASEYKAGVYCNVGDRMRLMVPAQTIYAAKNPTSDEKATFWIVYLSPKFSLSSEPGDCGVPYAAIWQGRFGVKNEIHNGCSIPLIDLDVASSADPSNGRIVTS